MPLFDLPDELLLSVAGHLSKLRCINSFVQTNRRIYHALNRFLYVLYIQRYEEFTLS
jgi:hypothetical protein